MPSIMKGELFMSNLSMLDKHLDESIQSFSKEINLLYPEGDKSPVTASDINELGRQVSYLADDFRKHIINYLKK